MRWSCSWSDLSDLGDAIWHWFPACPLRYAAASPGVFGGGAARDHSGHDDIVVGGPVNPNASWSDPRSADAANETVGYVAFWKGVAVEA